MKIGIAGVAATTGLAALWGPDVALASEDDYDSTLTAFVGVVAGAHGITAADEQGAAARRMRELHSAGPTTQRSAIDAMLRTIDGCTGRVRFANATAAERSDALGELLDDLRLVDEMAVSTRELTRRAMVMALGDAECASETIAHLPFCH